MKTETEIENDTTETLTENTETTKLKKTKVTPEKMENTESTEAVDSSEVLHSKMVTPENLHRLGGVQNNHFPFTVYADNHSQSQMVFPELGVALPAYSQNQPLTFKNSGSLNTFCTNMAHYADLWQWNEQVGIVLKGAK